VRTNTAGNIQLLLLVSEDSGKLKYAHPTTTQIEQHYNVV